MPKRTDIESILIIGAGPIIIGQACEFDYSGAQACRALREEGYRVILVNSNPATIMTDPSMADSTYIEPINFITLSKIIEVERPQALLPTMGGQTALNCALELETKGVLAKFQVELIGANANAIDKAENRRRFESSMKSIGLETPSSRVVNSIDQALEVADIFKYPCIIRPSFTLGGSGGGVAYNCEEFISICRRGLDLSPTSEVQIDESLLGWKEYEMEVVRDRNDNCIIICSIENLDPMGVHTGDSITIAPAQTLTDKEYQIMRDSAFAVLREIGVETGGSNVQFAVDPKTGRQVVIEMNPRVSRSSALASKATGFPIARVAAKLAVGFSLDELENDITGGLTPASFEPTLDYIVTKIPRFTFEKFPQANDRLTTQMKAVGEVMAIGRTFQESLQKALRGLEVGVSGFDSMFGWSNKVAVDELISELKNPGPNRLWCIADAFRSGISVDEIYEMTSVDSWFLVQIEDIVWEETRLLTSALSDISEHQIMSLKRKGFSDSRLGNLLGVSERTFRDRRISLGIHPVFKRVDTCAGEFSTPTAYLYSTYEEECEADVTTRRKVMVLGGGPNRIGQGIEFDYCCVHAALALSADGFETIMVNCNPETVSTDYDISDRLYFEPVTLEDVLAIYECEKPEGVIIQFGGQTPLRLAKDLESLGVNIIGTSPEAIDRAEDRGRFQEMVNRLDLKQPANAIVCSVSEGLAKASDIGFPIVVRPSYVLGGRAMEIVSDDFELKRYLEDALASNNEDFSVLLDHFLDSAIEVDIDAISDGKRVVIGGVMEHIEQAGVHSGDSACSLPTFSLSNKTLEIIKAQVIRMAMELQVVGLMNVQMAVRGESVFVLEVNPRASRTVPFVSKCIGVSLAKVAARCMVGVSLTDQQFEIEKIPNFFSVKEAVFPFSKFLGVDPILGPEMRSTGEVMGTGETFDEAFAKAHAATGETLPVSGCAFLSVRDADKIGLDRVAKNLLSLGFSLVATHGTCAHLESFGIECTRVNKVSEGRPNIVDMLKDKLVDFVINTTEGRQAIKDSSEIRRTALRNRVCYATTITGAEAIVRAAGIYGLVSVNRLQDLHSRLH